MKARVYIEIEQDFLMDTILMMEEKCSKLIDKAEYYRSLRCHSGANELFVKAERWQELADELRSIYDEKFKD